MEEKDFFVGIYDPLDVRRNLLESSREILKSLKTFTDVSEIRKNKLKLYKKMKSVMEELNLLVTKLDKKLPESHLRKKIEKTVSSPVYVAKEKSKKEGLVNELDKLESQLSEVERELSELK